MSNIAEFLKRSNKLMGGDATSDLTHIKNTLDALHKVNPDLVDSKLYEWVSRLIDTSSIAKDTQRQMDVLNETVELQQNKLSELIKTVQTQQGKLVGLTSNIELMRKSFEQLHSQLTLQLEGERQMKKKESFVLEELAQWLRLHG